MHPKTYEIKDFATVKEAIEKGFTIPLSRDESEELQGMNRKQRRAWLSQQRKAGKK